MSQIKDQDVVAVKEVLRVARAGGRTWRFLPNLRCLVTHVEEDYENYDFDVLPPSARDNLAMAAKSLGFRALGSRALQSPNGLCIRFPKPLRGLSSPLAGPLCEEAEREPESIFAVTPTQALLYAVLTDRLDAEVEALLALVEELPANLEKVDEQLQHAPQFPAWQRHRGSLAARQKEGVRLRREARQGRG